MKTYWRNCFIHIVFLMILVFNQPITRSNFFPSKRKMRRKYGKFMAMQWNIFELCITMSIIWKQFFVKKWKFFSSFSLHFVSSCVCVCEFSNEKKLTSLKLHIRANEENIENRYIWMRCRMELSYSWSSSLK